MSARYPCRFTPGWKPSARQTARVDRTHYINVSRCDSATRMALLGKLEQRRPTLIELWRDDPFVELLQKTFNAEVHMPLRKKHMVVVYGNATAEQKTALQKHFGSKHIINNWDGKTEIDDAEPTLIFTNEKPPYLQPYNSISAAGAVKAFLEETR